MSWLTGVPVNREVVVLYPRLSQRLLVQILHSSSSRLFVGFAILPIGSLREGQVRVVAFLALYLGPLPCGSTQEGSQSTPRNLEYPSHTQEL